MDVVIKIADRDALAVWTLPFVTSWRLSPDVLTERLADHTNLEAFPTAFLLGAHGKLHSIPPAQWVESDNQMIRIQHALDDKNLPEDEDRIEWITRSIEAFWHYKSCYVWRDEFEKWWYEQFIHGYYAPEQDENTELDLTPKLPEKHAHYFEKTELRELKTKAPLDKLDKEIQDAQITASGALGISLRTFIDHLLVTAIEDSGSMATFYCLVEVYGLVVYDKVIDGQIVPMSALLSSLRRREQQQPHDFMALSEQDFLAGKDSKFWEPLEKESRYSVERDDVATAYRRAGKSEFPWLSLVEGALVWLNVEEHAKSPISGVYGLPAKQEDYQDAFRQDAWTFLEALCWLKGRLPDSCRLHQLPKYYSTEIDLIQRAIKAKRLTDDSSSPKEWINWAREKEWAISPLIGPCLLSAKFGRVGTPKNVAEVVGDDGAELVNSETSPSQVKGEKYEHAETIAWKTKARKIGKEWFDRQQKESKYLSVDDVAKYVEAEFKRLDVRGRRDDYLDWKTIKREALTGITGRPANGKRKKT